MLLKVFHSLEKYYLKNKFIIIIITNILKNNTKQ